MNCRKMTELELIKQRVEARPGQPTFNPAYQYRTPYEDAKWMIARIEQLEEGLKSIREYIEPHDEAQISDVIKGTVMSLAHEFLAAERVEEDKSNG